jgi:RimJ/RimL family protein N-acetyltransferase
MERLSYRTMSMEDLDAFAEFVADPECTRYLLNPVPRPRDEARVALRHWIEVGMQTALDGEEIVGWVGYVPRSFEWGDDVELGWLIRRKHWGNGYASEAAFDQRRLGPERVVHLIHPENAASIAVARKLGAEHERDTLILDGPVSIYASSRSS